MWGIPRTLCLHGATRYWQASLNYSLLAANIQAHCSPSAAAVQTAASHVVRCCERSVLTMLSSPLAVHPFISRHHLQQGSALHHGPPTQPQALLISHSGRPTQADSSTTMHSRCATFDWWHRLNSKFALDLC